MTSTSDTTSRAASGTERPVHLLCANRRLAESLALDLRHHGLRIRTFVNPDVLLNAVRGEAPIAVVSDIAFADAVAEISQSSSASNDEPVLLFLGNDTFEHRLRAVRAGGVGYYAVPINRSALLHQLTSLMSFKGEDTRRILIVDGLAGALADAARGLDTEGFRTRTVQQPRRVLEELERGSYRLILLNDDLAGMRGTEVLQVIRQSPRFHALPAIVLTSGDKRRLDHEVTSAGADALLGLPIATADLAGIIKSKLQRAEQLLEAYSYTVRRDSTSGLFNRSYFMDALRHAVSEATANHGRAALLWLNAAPGGDAPAAAAETDGVLVQVADILSRQLPPLAMAARIDAAAVAILLPDPGASELEALLSSLGEQLAPALGTKPTIGATLLTGRQRSASDALARAQEAASLKSGRADGESRAVASTAAPSPSRWTGELRAALRENRFRLVYQPIASLSGQPTSFYEVFTRMVADDGRDILPQEFLAGIEAGGLAEQLDRWILSRAVHVLESQRELRDKPTFFVKLFPDTVEAGEGLINWLGDIVQTAGLQPERLVLQIRQQCATTRAAETQRFADAARSLGCRLAVEHFTATGEAAQQLLLTLRPDFVRLSPSLTQDIGTSRDHQRMVETISGQCRAIGAKPVAALVQDALNLSVLWRCGVEYIQGNFMQEPVDVFSLDSQRSAS